MVTGDLLSRALAAWRGIGGFREERGSLRTWLYTIATSRCLNARRAATRRPAREWDMSRFHPPLPTPRDERVWLQPFPDALLENAAADGPLGPQARSQYGPWRGCTRRTSSSASAAARGHAGPAEQPQMWNAMSRDGPPQGQSHN
jgi:hypothetical protein